MEECGVEAFVSGAVTSPVDWGPWLWQVFALGMLWNVDFTFVFTHAAPGVSAASGSIVTSARAR